MSSRLLIMIAAAAALVGCALYPVFEGGRTWNEGWREGEVEKVGTASELGPQEFHDCRYRGGGAGRAAPGLFVVIGMRNMGRHRHHVVPVEPGKEPQVGAAVLTNWRGCEAPIARTTR